MTLLLLLNSGIAAPPVPVASAVDATHVNVTWTAVPGAVTYDLQRDGVTIATGITGTSYSDSGLTGSTDYHYALRSVNAKGSSAWSGTRTNYPFTAANGAVPPGWTISPPVGATVDVQTNRMRQQVTGSGYQAAAAVATVSPTVPDIEMTGYLTLPQVTGEFYYQWYWRTVPTGAYAFEITPSANAVRFMRIDNGAQNASSGGTGITFVAGHTYRWRLQSIGTTHKFKIWDSTTAEPVAWNKTSTDATYTAAGGVELHLVGGSAAATVVAYEDDIVIGTGTALVTTPVSAGIVRPYDKVSGVVSRKPALVKVAAVVSEKQVQVKVGGVVRNIG